MAGERRDQVVDLYAAALERAPAERPAYLDEACAGDEALRQEVESLLRFEPASARFLERPAAAAISGSGGAVGQQLGAFTILAPLGAGGMGEVYRARDTKLGRDVAIKILPPHFTSDAERRARFAREARLLATLNHPHIGAIYGLEEAGGRTALVLELVEGPTLADRLARGPLPVAEAVAIARQIGEALDAAHEKGIVHRDLKPANIVLQGRSGAPDSARAKVLDFGLAKAMSLPGQPTPRQTGSIEGTAEGRILGTPAYMSPEQARGLPVDKRTDIWAFGCIVFEMLSGRRAFDAETMTDTFARILEHEPDWGALRPATPAGVRRLLRRCLAKDAAQRLRDIGDAALELEESDATDSSVDTTRARNVRGRSRFFTPRRLGAAATLAGLAVITAWTITTRPSDTRPLYTLDLTLDGLEMTAIAVTPRLSPDGRWLLYRAKGQLWRRALNEFTPKPLADSHAASYPFWSPDGRQIAFVREGKIWTLPVEASQATPLGDAPPGLSGAASGVWTASGDLVLAGSDTVGLFSISVRDGKPREILRLDKRNEIDFHQVEALPDGRGFLVAVHRSQGADTIIAFVDGRRQTVLQLSGETIQGPAYSPAGYLLFERETTSRGIWAVRFSLDRLAPEGPPFQLVPGAVGPTVGSDGTLAFVHDLVSPSQLVWIDATGSTKPVGKLAGQLGQGSGPVMALSPDGRRLALSVDDARGTELWSYDLSRGGLTRLSAGATRVTSPIWTPDGRQIFFGAFGRGRLWNVYSTPSNEAGEPTRLLPESATLYRWPCTISPDGRWLIYAEEGADRITQLWLAPVDRPAAAQPLMKTPFRESYAKFSPNGRAVLYVSDESGRDEVYVRAFPIGPHRVQVSTNGGSTPLWSRDGRKVFYRTPAAMMEVTVTRTAVGLAASAPQQLFTVDPDSRFFDSFVVAPNGGFLLARASESARVSVMLNWSGAQLESGPRQVNESDRAVPDYALNKTSNGPRYR